MPITIPIHLRHLSVDHAEAGKRSPKIKFVNPNTDNYEGNIKHAAKLHKKGMLCIDKTMLKGQDVIVVGSGPSLKDILPEVKSLVEDGAIIMACKQAIKFLHDKGFKVPWACSMDPGAHIACPEKIFKSPGTRHIIASTSDPELFKYLSKEKVVLFHSATGYAREVELYDKLFKMHDCMGGGYNVVNRAVSAAYYMGAKRVYLAGTDCGWREDSTFYVDGVAPKTGVDMCDNGMVDGTPWHTRPDMLASGVALAKLGKLNGDRLVFLGDTLPSKLVHKDKAFLDKCAAFNG